jgi:MoaA/NifB/PqqE/SkfB family radical SAM enzyme
MLKKGIKMPPEYKYICAFLTMRCNLNCSFCLNSLDKSKDFDRTKFKEIDGQKWVDSLNRIDPANIPITFSGGEVSLHKDFVYILNNLKPELNVDILTNLQWGKKGIENFIKNVNPNRIKRDSPYASIRVSYHPEQMGDGEKLVEDVKKLKDAGFSIGIWSVLYPSSQQLSAVNQMQFRCRDQGIDFRLKEFTGEYKTEFYGDYSKYPGAVNNSNVINCQCKTSELLIGPNGSVYRCHRDLFLEEGSVGNILNPNFQIDTSYKSCNNYGQCHPCDVKVKTDYKQRLGHTSVDIKFLS